MDWNIDLEGSGLVLMRTANAAAPFNKLATDYGESLAAIMEGLNYDIFALVATAVGEYSEHWAPTLNAAATQVGASLTGLQNALQAYVDGQEEMAMNAQYQASIGYIPELPGSTVTDPNGGDTAV